MKKAFLGLFLLLLPFMAHASTSAQLINSSASHDSITVSYQLQGDADGVCLILDYDYSDGFFHDIPTVKRALHLRSTPFEERFA